MMRLFIELCSVALYIHDAVVGLSVLCSCCLDIFMSFSDQPLISTACLLVEYVRWIVNHNSGQGTADALIK
ncbi:hypothetical protein F9C07_1450352 [Aspergillus flavus]|uniref:Uncharacterized protein n=1 Tax=Aspergillus flavus (strain ATCC 200026 / FGSC A1120 / IAM 13836 / NRRL 3357 / JCM 12722 / SRRC 167) TaxID=332952 RepID=A0A7U2QW27_ASPFN|nr:hypothetical protein F9C07_1450352 [Aspergillus flavus]